MSSPKTGSILEWYEDRGFGFLADESEGERVFLHIRELVNGHFPPRPGDSIAFVMGTDPKGRPQAVQATNLDSKSRLSHGNWLALLILLILPVVAFSQITFAIGHIWVATIATIASIVTYAFYSRDKRLSVTGGFRISELRLHVLELIGGWPGAFIAQRRFRHKCSKTSYRFVFWTIVLGHQLLAIDVIRDGEVSYTIWAFIRPFFDFLYP